MRLRIIAIGKPKLAFAKSGIDEYLGRIRPISSIQMDFIKVGNHSLESETLLERSNDAFRVIIDEHSTARTR